MYFMEILTHDECGSIGTRTNNILNLTIDFVPQMLGVTPEKRHVDFKMAVADFNEEGVFIVCNRNPFLVFQMGWTVSRD